MFAVATCVCLTFSAERGAIFHIFEPFHRKQTQNFAALLQTTAQYLTRIFNWYLASEACYLMQQLQALKLNNCQLQSQYGPVTRALASVLVMIRPSQRSFTLL